LDIETKSNNAALSEAKGLGRWRRSLRGFAASRRSFATALLKMTWRKNHLGGVAGCMGIQPEEPRLARDRALGAGDLAGGPGVWLYRISKGAGQGLAQGFRFVVRAFPRQYLGVQVDLALDGE